MKYSTIMRESLPNLSPPSRGAWIEIPLDCCMIFSAASPPSQGAWIEIEEVQIMRRKMNGRPPRGGRGLKYRWLSRYWENAPSPPSRGAWIEICLY